MEALAVIPMIASLMLEAVKYLLRKFILNDPNYQFPMELYGVLLPMFQLIAAPLLVFTGFLAVLPDLYDFSSPSATIKTVLVVLFQSLISVFYHNTTISPLKTELKIQKMERELASDAENTPENPDN